MINSDEVNDCIICMESPIIRGILSCRHSFCFACIDEWSKHENTCPLCKSRFLYIDRHEQRVPALPADLDSSEKINPLVERISIQTKDQNSSFDDSSNFLNSALPIVRLLFSSYSSIMMNRVHSSSFEYFPSTSNNTVGDIFVTDFITNDNENAMHVQSNTSTISFSSGYSSFYNLRASLITEGTFASVSSSQFTSSNNQQRSSSSSSSSSGTSASTQPQRSSLNPHNRVSSSVSDSSDHSMTSSSSSSITYTSSVPTGRHHRQRNSTTNTTTTAASDSYNRVMRPIISESPLNTDELRTINQTRRQFNRPLDLDVDHNLFSHSQQTYMNPRLQYFSLSDNFLRFDEYDSHRSSQSDSPPNRDSILYQPDDLEQSMDDNSRGRSTRSQHSTSTSTPSITPPTNIPPTTSIITEASYITPELRSIPVRSHSGSHHPQQPLTNLTTAPATNTITATTTTLMPTVGRSSRKRQCTEANHQCSDPSQPQSHSQPQSSSGRRPLRHHSNSSNRSHNNNNNNNNNNNARGVRNSTGTTKNNTTSYSSEKRSRK